MVLTSLRILKLALREETVGHVGRYQVHVLHVVIYQVDVMAEWLHDGSELLLFVRNSHRRDLRRRQIRLVLAGVGLVGHHAEGHGEEEVATALE